MTDTDSFMPDWASPPGDTIERLIEEKKLTKLVTASNLRMTVDCLDKLLIGAYPIGEELADLLSKTFGCTKNFWIKRESTYRKDLARMVARKKKKITQVQLRNLKELYDNRDALFRMLDGVNRNIRHSTYKMKPLIEQSRFNEFETGVYAAYVNKDTGLVEVDVLEENS